jgi:putative heme degradation protein
MDKLKTCIGSLRVLSRQRDPDTQVAVERLINQFLREEDGSLSASLERVGKAINAEADKSVLGEDWSLMQDYVQWCRETLAVE